MRTGARVVRATGANGCRCCPVRAFPGMDDAYRRLGKDVRGVFHLRVGGGVSHEFAQGDFDPRRQPHVRDVVLVGIAEGAERVVIDTENEFDEPVIGSFVRTARVAGFIEEGVETPRDQDAPFEVVACVHKRFGL